MTLTERWSTHRLKVRLTAVRYALHEDKNPELALTALIDTARWCQGRFETPAVWLELILLATEVAIYLDKPGEYHAFLEYFGETGLPDDPRPPRELFDTLQERHRDISPDNLHGVGVWLRDLRPTWPLGPYLIGHALSHRALARHLDAAEAFAQAARRAERAGDDTWAAHCRLRQGSTLLTTGAQVSQGRQILGKLDWSRLGPRDRLWMSVALSSSPRWTDRVRALDILLDLHRAISRARPDHRTLRLTDLRRGAARVFKMAGLTLPEIEAERLEEVSHTFFSGEERQRWLGHLSARQQLSRVASLPMDQAEEVFPLLDKLAAIYPDRWRPAKEGFRVLSRAWTGHHDPTAGTPGPRRRDPRLPVVDGVGRVLALLAPHQNTRLQDLLDALATLNNTLSTLKDHDDGADLRPIALIWPRLLESTASPDQPGLPEALATLATHYARNAPPPGYGWWPLAAHLFQAGFPGAATPIAEAALDHAPHRRDSISRFVARSRFQEAVETTDAPTARRWLDAL